MNVLIVGGFDKADTLKTISDGFEREGHTVENLYERALYSQGLNVLSQAIDKVVQKQFDFVFLWNVKEHAFLPHIETLRKLKCPIVWYTFDDPYYYDFCDPKIPFECDYILTSCEDTKEEYIKKGKRASVLYPPVDEVVHTRMPTGDYVCSFSFIAYTVYHKSSFPYVKIQRRDIVRALYKAYPRAVIHLYGLWDGRNHWGDPVCGVPELKSFYKGRTTYTENPLVYFNTKMNFNTHLQSYRRGYYNQRQFDILGSGGFLLCDKVNGIEEVFKRGVHLDWFETIDEMIDKVRFYFLNPKLVPRTAQRGYHYVHQYFNSRQFVRKVIDCLKQS
jgi:spore maturation protein CgeB